MSQTHCDIHGLPWKIVPAGVSKTAVNADGTPKAYSAFTACPERGCRQKPPLERPASLPPKTPMVPATPTPQNPAGDGFTPKLVKEEPDWDAIAQGKVRHGVVCAMIEAGKTKEEIYRDAPGYVTFIMTEVPF